MTRLLEPSQPCSPRQRATPMHRMKLDMQSLSDRLIGETEIAGHPP